MAAPRALPPDLAAAARWLDSWRRRRTTRHLPDEAWRRAADLARRHGVSATCRALRVDYYKFDRLRQRRGAASAVSAEKRPCPSGRFRHWPSGDDSPGQTLEAHEVHLLLSGGDPEAAGTVAPMWRPIHATG